MVAEGDAVFIVTFFNASELLTEVIGVGKNAKRGLDILHEDAMDRGLSNLLLPPEGQEYHIEGSSDMYTVTALPVT
jgi:hypothetical protein